MRLFKNVSFLMLVLITLAGKSQQPDSAIVSVHYTFLHMQDTTSPTEIHTENMLLVIGKTSSIYRSLDKMNAETESRRGFEDGSRMAGKVPNLYGHRFVPAISYYKDQAHAKLTNIEVAAGKEYMYNEELPQINWNVTQDTKIIEGLNCQKATTTFRGRFYEAWFCKALPYSNGPWKLGGLPGLIIEAYDQKKEVVFRFAGFEDISGQHLTIALADDAITTTPAELVKLKDALKKNPSAIQGNGVSGSVRAELGTKSDITPANKKKEINNPIEKPI